MESLQEPVHVERRSVNACGTAIAPVRHRMPGSPDCRAGSRRTGGVRGWRDPGVRRLKAPETGVRHPRGHEDALPNECLERFSADHLDENCQKTVAVIRVLEAAKRFCTVEREDCPDGRVAVRDTICRVRSEEHTSELQSRLHLVCR